MAYETERIRKLRLHALDKEVLGTRSQEGQLLWQRGWLKNSDVETNLIRRAKAKAYVLGHSKPVIDDEELIVGKPCYRDLTKTEEQELDVLQKYSAKAYPKIEGMGSHMAIDYENKG